MIMIGGEHKATTWQGGGGQERETWKQLFLALFRSGKVCRNSLNKCPVFSTLPVNFFLIFVKVINGSRDYLLLPDESKSSFTCTYESGHVFGANASEVEAVRLSYETWVWNNPHAFPFREFMDRTSHTNRYFTPTRQCAQKISFEVFCTAEQRILFFLFDHNLSHFHVDDCWIY